MDDELLATPEDCLRFGKGEVSEGSLRTASARARGFTGQHISTKVQTVIAAGSLIKLPGRPLRSVTKVIDAYGNPVRYRIQPGGMLRLDWTPGYADTYGDELLPFPGDCTEITYTSGWDVVPDRIVEVICTIAARLEEVSPALSGGLQQATVGGESQGFGWDSYKGVGDLVTSEKEALARIFPRRGGLLVGRQ